MTPNASAKVTLVTSAAEEEKTTRELQLRWRGRALRGGNKQALSSHLALVRGSQIQYEY